ncbi:hypothetical protein OKA06_00830 [Novosphingobium sp. MW5]|nr:hypothetical protein [Novosphingobium sp. MW5]
MSGFIKRIRSWRPSERELRLLLACCGAALCLCWSISYDLLQSAKQDLDAADVRLTRVQAETAVLSSSEQRDALSRQRMTLAALSMFDATPSISQLRMREELVDLADQAGFRNLEVISDVPTEQAANNKPEKVAYSAIITTLEADFDLPALIALIGQIELYQTGYLIEGIELRNDGKSPKMRASFRILHRNAGPLP